LLVNLLCVGGNGCVVTGVGEDPVEVDAVESPADVLVQGADSFVPALPLVERVT
jgi:hypothetical protein